MNGSSLLRVVTIAAIITIGVAASPVQAQLGFTEFALTDSTLNSIPATDFWIASAAPADVDGDGDLDLLIAGYYVVYYESVEDRLVLYRNDGAVDASTWGLTPIALDATGLYFGSADIAWGDYDGDADPDVVVVGDGGAALYRNDGGVLVRTPTVLPTYQEDSDFSTMDLHSITWSDYDNDGDPDLLMPSTASDFGYLPTALLRNDGPGTGDAWSFTDSGIGLPVTSNGASAWADMEGDGDLDLLLANISPWGDNFVDTYRNDAGTLVLKDTGLAFIRYGMTDWGDADNDGDLDIVYAGNIDLSEEGGETVVRILFDDGQGGYTPFDVVHDFQSPLEPWLDFHAVTWADYDSDGDVDLLVSGEWLGESEIFGRAVVYANSGGNFTLASDPLPAPIVGNAGGAFTWFDVDGDRDLDYFVAGGYYVPGGNGLIEARTQLFRNDATVSNAAPSAASNLNAAPSGPDGAMLTWNPAIDDGTPQASLTYELEVVAIGASSTIERALPEPGNVSRNTTWTLHGLAPGTYGWTVRALDSAFNAGLAATGTFTVGAVTGVRSPSSRGLLLSAPYPNPVSGTGHIALSIDRAQRATVAVYDVRGRRVAILHDGPLPMGTHTFSIDGVKLPSGTYFIRATGGGHSATRRVTLLN